MCAQILFLHLFEKAFKEKISKYAFLKCSSKLAILHRTRKVNNAYGKRETDYWQGRPKTTAHQWQKKMSHRRACYDLITPSRLECQIRPLPSSGANDVSLSVPFRNRRDACFDLRVACVDGMSNMPGWWCIPWPPAETPQDLITAAIKISISALFPFDRSPSSCCCFLSVTRLIKTQTLPNLHFSAGIANVGLFNQKEDHVSALFPRFFFRHNFTTKTLAKSENIKTAVMRPTRFIGLFWSLVSRIG